MLEPGSWIFGPGSWTTSLFPDTANVGLALSLCRPRVLAIIARGQTWDIYRSVHDVRLLAAADLANGGHMTKFGQYNWIGMVGAGRGVTWFRS